mmetsp:Transcript_9699/g.16329  ORF Transcript_9699/g.16329 Transcript_9699/m.16329 type:complete len:95 (-) Transcript_9699:1557-1841(-)
MSPNLELIDYKQEEGMKEMVKFIGDNWAFGALGIDSTTSNRDRIQILEAMLSIGLKNTKILGETCNLIMADSINNVEAVTQILNILAKFKYSLS